MMDISDVTIESIVEREGHKNDFESKATETSEEGIEDETPPASGDRGSKNLKRSSDEDSMNSKKRRKQLKPIRIATNLEDMVKVPKQIIGLNNDLDIINDLSHTVPKELSPKPEISPNDVHRPPRSPAGATKADPSTERSRLVDKPEVTDVHVPNIDVGPNYVTNPHFIFPLSFQPVKTPGFWSEASLKIFNQEAYCELCKKEFCNKYFLKTHKANKHGIYVDVPAASKVPSMLKEKPPENGRTFGESDCATCDLCNKKFCNKYFVRRHKTKSHGLAEEEVSLGYPESIVQNSSNSTKETDSTLEPLALVSKEDQDNHSEEECEEEEEEGPLNLIVGGGKEDSDEGEIPEEDLDECSSENIEKLQTMLLRLNPSEIESKACRVCNDIVEGSGGEHKCVSDKKEYLSEGNDSSSESKSEFPKSENPEYIYRLDHLKQMKPTSSYCEICNKELCNKYFMRTHMQRMHGIEIEHGTQIGGVVCNICNKELCSKYFLRVHKQNTHGIMTPNTLLGPSTSGNALNQRIELKPSRGDPRLASNFSQVCYICNKRFRSPKWLQAHFLSDHREEVAKESKEGDGEQKDEEGNPCKGLPLESPEGLDVISKIFWENNSASKTYNCSQCPFTTSVLAFLFVHERSHFVLAQDQPEMVKPSVSLQNLIHDKTFWQHKITQQLPECLDLSAGKPKYVTFEQNGS